MKMDPTEDIETILKTMIKDETMHDPPGREQRLSGGNMSYSS